MEINSNSWDNVADNEEFHSDSSAFYLYKRQELINLVQNWGGNHINNGRILKTDLIEEALRQDHVLFWLAKNNQAVFGMDISSKMTAYAKARSRIFNSKLNFATADVRYLPFKDGCFDLIISNSTCDHFPEIDLALKELYRVLKPSGTMIITLHNRLDFTFWLFIILKKVMNFIPELHFECCYTRQNMQNRLKKAGFFIEDFTTNLHVPFVLISLMTTLEKWITGKYHKNILKLNCKIIRFFEKMKGKDKIFDYLFSSLIACKAIKKGYNING
jgi:ubiquinone/menaquinone biosynthesis C-methylase UbiE